MKDNNLSIKDWQKGIAPSAYLGFSQMVNVDIFSKPGSLKISNRLNLDTGAGSLITGLIIRWAQDPRTGDVYMADENGKLYKRDAGSGTWSVITGYGSGGNVGNGLAVWKDYLVYARSTALDFYGPLSGSPTWTNGFSPATLSASFVHPMMSSVIGRADDTLYIGNLNYVDTLYEVIGQTFDPGNVATYAYSNKALTLKNGYTVNCLEELGASIVLGTTYGASSGTAFNVADMFFWDGFSEAIYYSQTVKFSEDGVKMTKNVGNTLYTIAGSGEPRIFRSLTSQAVEYLRFNNIDIGQYRVTLHPQAIDQKDGEVMFGIGQNFSVNGPSPMGIYSVRDGAYATRYLISTGNDGSNSALFIGVAKMINADNLMVSWQDGSNYGVDILSSSNFYPNSAYVESPLMTVGTESDPKTYERVEIRLGKKLNTGDSVVLKGRKSLDDTYVTLATFGAPFVGREVAELKVSNISNLTEFQCRIELNTASNSQVSPELKEVVFY